MSSTTVASKNEAQESLVKYFVESKDSPSCLKRMAEDPLKVLESMGIVVEDQFKDAVALQLRAGADSLWLQAQRYAQEPATAQATNDDLARCFGFIVQPWGLVLVVHEEGVKYLQGGGDVAAGVLGVLAAASGVVFPPGLIFSAIIGVLAAALKIYAGAIKIFDRGQGVYLTWVWPAFVPFLGLIPNPMYGCPVVSSI